MAAPTQQAAQASHVIELASPAYIRLRYVRRVGRNGAMTVTVHCAKARRFDPTAAAKALRTLQPTIEAAGWTPSVVPAAALELRQ